MSRTAPTYAEFVAQYPAFASTAEASVTAALSFSGRLLDPAGWDDFYSDAVGLDTAHALALAALTGPGAEGAFKAAAGPVTSASAAGASASFASVTLEVGRHGENYYMKTIYGQQFLRLRSVVFTGAELST